MSLILMTTLFYKALLLQGEIWCWSLLGFKGLNIYELRCFTVLQVYYTLYIKNNNLPDGQREQDNQTEIEPL